VSSGLKESGLKERKRERKLLNSFEQINFFLNEGEAREIEREKEISLLFSLSVSLT
jgi:hypothetical protein